MSRLSYTFQHIAMATSTASGVGAPGLRTGSFIDGQLVVYLQSVGVGGWLRPIWQSSGDSVRWGDFLRGATMIATGVQILASPGGLGNWARVRWQQSSTALAFSAVFTFKE